MPTASNILLIPIALVVWRTATKNLLVIAPVVCVFGAAALGIERLDMGHLK